MNSNKWVPDNFYQQILASIPIVCVDLIIKVGNEFLLGKRINEPAMGQWFVPGGRVYKEETLKEAAVRKAKEEIGLNISQDNVKLSSVGETIFKEGEDRHSVNVVFLVELHNKPEITNFDTDQNQEFKWFSSINLDWHPYVVDSLKQAGLK